MYNRKEQGSNTEALLLDGPGVCSIERTHQTQSRGNWLLVVKNSRVKELGSYISTNVQQIYRHRQRQIPKLVGTNTNGVNNSNCLFMMDTTMSRMGTYAEVLKRQFVGLKTMKKKVGHSKPVEEGKHTSKEGIKGSNHIPGNGIDQSSTDGSGKKPQKTDPSDQRDHMINRFIDKQQTDIEIQNIKKYGSTVTEKETQVKQKTGYKNVTRTDTITKSQVEQMFTEKMAEITKTNQSTLQDIQDKMEEKIDRIIETRLRTATNLMADAVTNKIMASLKGISIY